MKTRTIRARLWFLTSLFVCNLLIFGATEVWNSHNIVVQLNDITKVQLPAIRNMTLTDMMHDGLRAVIYRALFVSTQNDKAAMEEVKSEYDEFSKNIYVYVGNISKLDIRAETQATIAASMPSLDKFVNLGREIIALAAAGKSEEAAAKIGDYQASFTELETSYEKMGEMIEGDAEASDASAAKITARAETLNLVLIVIGILGAFGSSILVIRSLSRVLDSVTDELTRESETLARAAEQISGASQELAESTTQQSSAIEETVTSMEEITSMIAQTAQNSSGTLTEAQNGSREAQQGKAVIGRMVNSMEDISQSNEQLQTIVKVIDEIKTKTKVINDIAFETKLLSFNASIEAARAGAHGRGFAVVAEEVGKLATVSSKAADEVRNLLDSSLNQVSGIVAETRKKVSGGQDRTKECEQAFSTMETSLDNIGRSVQLIATATREQEGGVKQTNTAMGEMERSTQTNSRAAEKLAGEANNLSNAAQSVNLTVAKMRALVRGSSSGSNPRPSPTMGHNSDSAPKGTSPSPRPETHLRVVDAPIVPASQNDVTEDVDRGDKRWNVA